MAVVKMVWVDCPREIPRANMIAIVSPAAAAIHSVNVSSCLVSGVFRVGVDFSIPEMRAHRGVGARPGDDHHAAAVRDRGVHERHVRLVPQDRASRR